MKSNNLTNSIFLKKSIDTGLVFGLGLNNSGQLGLGKDMQQALKPTLVRIDSPAHEVACGSAHSLILVGDSKEKKFEVLTAGKVINKIKNKTN